MNASLIQGYSVIFEITGASVIDSIRNKIYLLSLMHGMEDMKVNILNLAISIEQCAIGIY